MHWFTIAQNFYFCTLLLEFVTLLLLRLLLLLLLLLFFFSSSSSSSSSSSIGTTTLSWVSAGSTVVEHSQQDGFIECRCQRNFKPPTWRRNRDLDRCNFRYKRPPASEATLANPAAEVGTMDEKWTRILPKVTTSTSLLGSSPCRKAGHGTDGFTSPPKEGVLRIFFARKNPKASAGFEPANLGTKGQHATSGPPKPLLLHQFS
jgi:hypothetical protein